MSRNTIGDIVSILVCFMILYCLWLGYKILRNDYENWKQERIQKGRWNWKDTWTDVWASQEDSNAI